MDEIATMLGLKNVFADVTGWAEISEEQVLAAVARGLSNSEIASELYITLSTVKTHVASLMTKLDARNRVEIAIWAHQTGRTRARSDGERN